MTRSMPTPALLQAISRLDEAVARAEAALDATTSSTRDAARSRDAAIREAISELDSLIASVREKTDG